MSRKTRSGHSGDDSARSGNRLDPNARLDRQAHKLQSGIRHQWGARVRHERDTLAFLQARDERWRFPGFIVFMQTGRRRRDRVSREQVRRPPRVFGGDEGDVPENPERAGCDVFEVADRRRDEEQRAGHSMSAGNVYCTIKD